MSLRGCGSLVQRFYFDHNATTPVTDEVLKVLIPTLAGVYGNGSSIHYFGQVAKQHMEMARRSVATAVGADPREIVFVSGGTEADNLAILGSVRANPAARKHVVTTSIEHVAVLQACAQLEREGVEVTYVPVGTDGLVDPDDIRLALRPETVLVSVMHVNNETGVVQPVARIGALARELGVTFHVDGVQALGKVEVNLSTLPADLYSLSGHKVNAPKGVGALFARRGTRLAPVLHGGHHERDRRPGTENVPGVVAFAHAAEWAVANLDDEAERIRELRDLLEEGIRERVPAVIVNGGTSPRSPNTTNICFEAIEGEAMVISLDLKGFAVSSGSACSSGAVEPSHVLTAMGLTPESARSSVRFSLGRGNTLDQVDALIEAVTEAAAQLRRLSPAWRVTA
jgi:cysteine desulfurase